MSFAIDDEQNKQDASQTDAAKAQGDPSVSLGGGGGGVVNPGAAQSGQSQSAAKPSSSGSWTNLQSYMGANQDQGNQVGSDIAGTVGGRAETAKKDVDSAASDFSSQVNANTVNADDKAVGRAIQGATGAKAGSDQNSDDVSAFQRQYNANYSGPTDFTKESGYGQAQQDTDSALRGLDQTKSAAGRNVLLQDQYRGASTNGYNQGEQNFDQLLLENSKGAEKSLADVQNKWSGIGSALGTATTAENAQAKQAAATDQATASAARAALTGANTTFQSNMQKQTADAATKARGAYDQAVANMKSGVLTPEDAQALGLTGSENLYNVDPSQFLSHTADPTLYNSASKDNYAQAAALAKLAGKSSSDFLPGSYASQAGTAGRGYGFDAEGFKTATGRAKNEYETKAQDVSTRRTAVQQEIDRVIPAIKGNPGNNMQYQLELASAQKKLDQINAEQKALDKQYQSGRKWNGIAGMLGGSVGAGGVTHNYGASS